MMATYRARSTRPKHLRSPGLRRDATIPMTHPAMSSPKAVDHGESACHRPTDHGPGHHEGAGWRVAMLIEGLDIEVVGLDGSTLRRLVLDPTKDYQRMP